MKKTAILFALFCLAVNLHAATSITTPTVSGHWTMAGSPYKIYNDVAISSGQSLVIDPGVNVIFQGPYQMSVSGTLRAIGSAVMPVVFDVQDITGWTTDTTGHTGGWVGISFTACTSGITDSSEISYCNFSHIKNGPIRIERSMVVSNCTFSENWGGLFDLHGDTTSGPYELSHNTFLNNFAVNTALIFMYDALSDWYIHDNAIHDNFVGRYGSLLSCRNSKMLFSRNDVHDNIANPLPDTTEDVKMIEIASFSSVPCYAVLSENMIYENTTILTPPIYCSFAIADLYRNYICNNHHTNAALCAHAFGGGGMFLMGNNDYNNSAIGGGVNSIYTVRDNIIANNYSALYGGGIYVYNAKTLIANNTIVHNKAPRGGGIDLFMIDTVTVCVKNNILFDNENENIMYGTGNVVLTGLSQTNIRYDHNSITQPVSADLVIPMVIGGHVSMVSDTSTNVIDSTPGMAHATLMADYTESALTADFSLVAGSPCINKGMDSAVSPGDADYAGNNRINDTVDIGAYEYGAAIAGVSPSAPQDTMFKYCCGIITRYPPPIVYTQTITAKEKQVAIYPNPAINLVFISTPEASGKIELHDVTGATVLEKKVVNTITSFDIHALPRGIYVAVWINGARKDAQKLVVE